jgi:hypothetical protein
MKKIFEEGGILAQIPAMLAVLILFPLFGTSVNDMPVKVYASFYVWQGILCILPVLEHVIFMRKQGELHESGAARPVVLVFFIASFILTVLNCMRFQ